MESINTELALCGRKIECATTDTVFFSISMVSKGTVSLGTNLFLQSTLQCIVQCKMKCTVHHTVH